MNKNNHTISPDGIVLYAKTPGLTSFNSLYNIKKALNTTKVGHTGTLDSFAQGLLVVCTGKLTKLVSNITEFSKTYKAVIKFGTETDTLDYTGSTILTTELPTRQNFVMSIEKFKGELWQTPPVYSAIHINGKRASDLARNGVELTIPQRKITVFDSKILDLKCSGDLVEYALVEFSVSKGTYIRSLARDIAKDCNSCGHLAGLYRTKVGIFDIEDSVGKEFLPDFSIANSIKTIETFYKNKGESSFDSSKMDLIIQEQIKNNIKEFTPQISLMCGFKNLTLRSIKYKNDFSNGKPIYNCFFSEIIIEEYSVPSLFSVFYENIFCGLINFKNKMFSYVFVVNLK